MNGANTVHFQLEVANLSLTLAGFRKSFLSFTIKISFIRYNS
jgi:hypothetical protein